MISLSDYLKKIFIYIFILLIFLELVTITTNFFIIRKTFYDNIQSISSFLSNISIEFKTEIENKIKIVKVLYPTIEDIILENKDKPLNFVQKKLKEKYEEIFEISFIDKNGFIVESTNKKELGLNLMAFRYFKAAIKKAKKNIDVPIIIYPIFDKGDKFYKVFFIKYVNSKKYFLLLGYKINILNFLIMEAKKLSRIKNFKYFFHMVYIIREGSSYKFIINNSQKKFLIKEKHDNLLKLVKSHKNQILIKRIYSIELYNLVRFKNNPNVLAFHVKLTSSKFQKEIFMFLVSNIMVLIFYLIFSFYFYNELQTKIIIPIKKINDKIKNSEPITKGFLNTDILEIKNLKESYLKHLENIKLRKFIRRILNMYEKEKENLGKNIHDSIIQDLSYILIQLNDQRLSLLLKNKIKELRKIVVDNDFTMLKISGFNTYLDYLINIYQKRYPNVKFIKKIEKVVLKSEIQINLIRIIQEIISNAVKHSNCNEIVIEVFIENKNLNLIIKDNGKGFDIDEAEHKLEHFGLFHIRERVYSLDGMLSLNSNNNGTYYLIVIPII